MVTSIPTLLNVIWIAWTDKPTHAQAGSCARLIVWFDSLFISQPLKKIIFHCRANPPFHLWSVEIECGVNELTGNGEE